VPGIPPRAESGFHVLRPRTSQNWYPNNHLRKVRRDRTDIGRKLRAPVVARDTGGVPNHWDKTPRESVESECARRGRDAVVRGCIEILEGPAGDESLVVALGGPAAQQVIDGREGGLTGYWPRVWAARGLLYVWDDTAAPAVIRATNDEAWRVREMAAKVIARHEVGDGLDAMIQLSRDPRARVRAAAERAVQVLVSHRA
jgi:HEAT repeats